MSEWTPIIDRASELGERATIVVEAIAAEALGSSDHLEAALFLAYQARADRAAVQQLNLAIRQAEAMWSTRRLGLYGGLAGLGFVVEQVARENPEINEDTDAALLLELERGHWQGNPYLATGLAGFGVYFLERLPVPAARRGLELVAAHLEEVLGRGNIEHPMGVSEGVWGIAHFLSRLADAGIQTKCMQSLSLDTAAADESPEIAAICLQIGLPERAQAVIGRCIGNDWPLARAAGVAHAWNRIWRLNHDPACKAAAVEWLRRAVNAWDDRWDDTATGPERFWLGLVLIAALTPVEPEWDRLLCLSGV